VTHFQMICFQFLYPDFGLHSVSRDTSIYLVFSTLMCRIQFQS
jgi:hypothetical protein